jgi:hypothetical protein
VVPSGFEAYARILHRAHVVMRREGQSELGTLRWAEIAERRGKVVHPRVQIESLIDNPDANDYEHWRVLGGEEEWLPPYEDLEEIECLALGTVLRGFTRTPQPAWFWIWDGYGDLGDEFDDLPKAFIQPAPVATRPGVDPAPDTPRVSSLPRVPRPPVGVGGLVRVAKRGAELLVPG